MCENSVKLIFLSLVIVNSLLVNGTQAITTTHHDKPAESRLPLMARTMMVRDEAATNASPKSTLMTSNVTLPLTERHKRLLPYMTFYLGREASINGGNELRSTTAPLKPNYVSVARPQDAAQYYKYQPIQQQQQRQQHNEAIETKTQFTPFLESNALPGPFLPIVRDPGIESKERQTGKLPNYSAIYDKLSQIKLQNDPRYKTIDYAPPAAYEPNYSTIQRTRPHLQFAPNAKTIVQSYTPTSVDLSPYDYRRKPQTHHQGGNKSPYGEFARPVIVFRPKPQKDYAYIQQQLLSDDKPHVVYVQKPQSARPHYQPFPTPSQSHPYVDSKSNQAILLKKLPPTDETNGQHDVHPAILRHHHQQLQQQQQPYVYVEDNKQFNRQQLRPVFVSPTEPPQTAPIFVEPIYVDNDKPQRNRPVLVASKPIYVKGTQQQHSGTGDDYLRDDQQLYGKGAKVIEEQQLVNYEEQQPQPVNYEENQHQQQQQQHYEQPFDQQYEKQPTPNYQTITEPYDYPTTTITNAATTEDPNNLSLILKNLQETNALPETLTPENIDNSIKTLVRILSALKKEPKFARPIVVQEEETGRDYVDETDNETGDVNNDDFDSVHHYPQDTQEGGTPGKPGVDYPALSSIPPTSFNCKTQRYKGFFGDPDTHCQVWHYCDLNGGQASFLCPNGTIFSQVALTCDWWYNVKCATTTQLYVLNERLYKYILPLSPKFPEDYSGPLVDRYLALKFREMEAKMKKERKQKQKDSGEDDDKEAPKTDDADDLKLASEQTTTETASYEDDVSSTSAEKL